MRKSLAIVPLLAVMLLTLPGGATAGDRAVVSTFSQWAARFATDADTQARLATAAHPRPAALRAATVRLREDALRAQQALRARRASTTRGKHAQRLALHAFGVYAVAEQELMLKHFSRARVLVVRAGVLLQRAAKLTL